MMLRCTPCLVLVLLLILWGQADGMSFGPRPRAFGLGLGIGGSTLLASAASARSSINEEASSSKNKKQASDEQTPQIVANSLGLSPSTVRSLQPSKAKALMHTASKQASKQANKLKAIKPQKIAKAAAKLSKLSEQLSYVETMLAGALSRTLAQTLMHPANTYKTVLQLRRGSTASQAQMSFKRLLAGIDAQFLLSLPHGAFHFCAIDTIKLSLQQLVPTKALFLVDLFSSAVSTVVCSVVSTPQMVLTDRLMAGVYPNLGVACSEIMKHDGFKGFYAGWLPALAQKIPSYGLTWMLFQQLKRLHDRVMERPASAEVNFALGAVAATASVTAMIPVDTIKTRLVVQLGSPDKVYYKGMRDCFFKMIKEEGPRAFFISLPPRLFSVVPMIAIQFGIYENMKTFILREKRERREREARDRLLLATTAGAAGATAGVNSGAGINGESAGAKAGVVGSRRANSSGSSRVGSVGGSAFAGTGGRAKGSALR